MKEYETFEDWFDEVELYSLRSMRFYDDFKMWGDNPDRMIVWLRAAFDSARLEKNDD